LNSYPHLVDAGLSGSPEGATDQELGAAARMVLDEVYANELAAIRDRFQLRFSHDRASACAARTCRAGGRSRRSCAMRSETVVAVVVVGATLALLPGRPRCLPGR
jgi:hypothetical protein